MRPGCSLAIMSDAAHLLSDVGGFVVSLIALRLAKQQSPDMTYGCDPRNHAFPHSTLALLHITATHVPILTSH